MGLLDKFRKKDKIPEDLQVDEKTDNIIHVDPPVYDTQSQEISIIKSATMVQTVRRNGYRTYLGVVDATRLPGPVDDQTIVFVYPRLDMHNELKSEIRGLMRIRPNAESFINRFIEVDVFANLDVINGPPDGKRWLRVVYFCGEICEDPVNRYPWAPLIYIDRSVGRPDVAIDTVLKGGLKAYGRPRIKGSNDPR